MILFGLNKLGKAVGIKLGLDGSLATDSAGATDVVPLTPSDTVDQPGGPFRAIQVQGAGTVAIICANGTTRSFPSGFFLAGQPYAIQFTRLLIAGTTATGVYGYA